MVRVPVENYYEEAEYGVFGVELFEEELGRGRRNDGNEGMRMFQLRGVGRS